MCLRALAYVLRNGGNGLTRVTECAVLNANYLLASLRDILPVPHDTGCLHEFVASGSSWKRDYGVRTLDIAKRLLDYGYHAPTTYFPLLVPECFLIEPTETEALDALDGFVDAMIKIQAEAQTNPEVIKTAPQTLPVRRLDDVRAARELDLRWQGSA